MANQVQIPTIKTDNDALNQVQQNVNKVLRNLNGQILANAPVPVVPGPPSVPAASISNPIAFPSVWYDIGGNLLTKGTIVYDHATYRRVGQYAIIDLNYSVTAPGSGATTYITLKMPTGLVIDASVLSVAFNTSTTYPAYVMNQVGYGYGFLNADQYNIIPQAYDANSIRFYFSNVAVANFLFTSGQWNGSNPIAMKVTITVPIVGW